MQNCTNMEDAHNPADQNKAKTTDLEDWFILFYCDRQQH